MNNEITEKYGMPVQPIKLKKPFTTNDMVDHAYLRDNNPLPDKPAEATNDIFSDLKEDGEDLLDVNELETGEAFNTLTEYVGVKAYGRYTEQLDTEATMLPEHKLHEGGGRSLKEMLNTLPTHKKHVVNLTDHVVRVVTASGHVMVCPPQKFNPFNDRKLDNSVVLVDYVEGFGKGSGYVKREGNLLGHKELKRAGEVPASAVTDWTINGTKREASQHTTHCAVLNVLDIAPIEGKGGTVYNRPNDLLVTINTTMTNMELVCRHPGHEACAEINDFSETNKDFSSKIALVGDGNIAHDSCFILRENKIFEIKNNDDLREVRKMRPGVYVYTSPHLSRDCTTEELRDKGTLSHYSLEELHSGALKSIGIFPNFSSALEYKENRSKSDPIKLRKLEEERELAKEKELKQLERIEELKREVALKAAEVSKAKHEYDLRSSSTRHNYEMQKVSADTNLGEVRYRTDMFKESVKILGTVLASVGLVKYLAD